MKVPDLLAKCKTNGWDSVAITNHGNMFNMMDYVEQGQKAGIKVIPGIESYMTWDFPCTSMEGKHHDQRYHIIILAQNQTGYKNLLKLSSLSYLKGFYHKPRIDFQELTKYNEGLIVLSACMSSKVSRTILTNYESTLELDIRNGVQVLDKKGEPKKCLVYGEKKANLDTDLDKVINHFKAVLGDRFYLEIQHQPHYQHQELVNENILAASKRTGVKVVVTADSHYLNKEDHRAWQIMMKIASGGSFGDDLPDNFWVKTAEEIKEHIPEEVIEETGKVAARCEQIVFKKEYKLPHIDLNGETADDDLLQQVEYGLKHLAHEIPKHLKKEYRERALFELEVLKKMGFATYLLVVGDYTNWAKSKGIAVGPGRGSAAGSLVCWLIGITDVDPIKYDLLFERFINPDRISMPDIDMDFQDNRRDEIKQYLLEKYGQDHVASITTFGTMAAKGSLRAVAKYMGLSYMEGDLLAKTVPEGKRGKNVYLADAIQDKDFAQLIKSKPIYQDVFDISSTLEGMIRNCGTHAAGVVISDKNPLVDYVPLYLDKEKNVVTQFDMNLIEKIGLIKFDLLGLSTLTTIQNTIEFIREREGKCIDINEIDMEDGKVFDLLCSGDLVGIFQLSGSEGFKDLVMKVQPRNIEEIGDITSLYRPGPLDNGFDKAYIKNKHSGEYSPQIKVSTKIEEVDAILRPTKGVIIYQEQVMKLARVLAGFSLGEADLLRRAMGKKDAVKMQAEKAGFINGCVKHGVIEEEATEIFDILAKFAEYGFNKSHAIAYSVISYQTAWLKTYYPVEYLAAYLTEEMAQVENVLPIISNCADKGIKLLPPDINLSEYGYIPEKEAIRFGLGGVEGLGETVVNEIISKRDSRRPFKSLFDFCNIVNLSKVNKKGLEALVKAGAFDKIL